MLHAISSVFDLNLIVGFSHSRRRLADELWSHGFVSSHGFGSASRVSQMRSTLQRRVQSPKVLVHGSVPVHGLRTARLSRKSEGHQGLFECRSGQALPSRNSSSNF